MVSAASREAWKAALWWAPVFFAVHDCIASVHFIKGWTLRPTPGSSADEGDVVLAERLSPRLYKYKRGEVVLLRSPEDPATMLISRLIGLEGDWVALPGETKVEKIPKGRCWVEADPQAGAADSRSRFGAVPLALIQGHVNYVLWPPSRWGAVDSKLPPGRVIAMGSFATAGLDEDTDW